MCNESNGIYETLSLQHKLNVHSANTKSELIKLPWS